jgi:hypothetical protein
LYKQGEKSRTLHAEISALEYFASSKQKSKEQSREYFTEGFVALC